jgi:hypothetical protein
LKIRCVACCAGVIGLLIARVSIGGREMGADGVMTASTSSSGVPVGGFVQTLVADAV